MINLIVEDGTGLSNANSYVELADVTEFAELYSDFDWDGMTEEDQKKAVINASRFVDLKYRARFKGTILKSSQALAFPRTEFKDSDGVTVESGTLPRQLTNTVILATLNYAETGSLDLQHNTDNAVKRESVGVGQGAVQETTEYFYPKNENDYVDLDVTIAPILKASSMNQFNTVRG